MSRKIRESAESKALEACTVRFLRRRSRLSPDLRLVRWNGEAAVAKDWASAPRPLRLYGRWSLGREWKLLKKVEGLEGVPRVLARFPEVLIMTFLEGRPLSSRLAGDLPADFFERLGELLEAIHARGVVHLDLRQRRNVLLGNHGRPVILDFGAGVDLARWGWVGRVGLGWTRFVDRMAVLKLKGKYAPDRLTEEERRRARWARRVRFCWPPNLLHVVKTRVRRSWRERI